MKKSNKVVVVFGALAAVVIAAVYFQFPPFEQGDARGAIGAVEKYRDEQIESTDVILGDEQQRKQEAALYGDLLEDAIRLEGMSGELSSFAASLEAADSASLSAMNRTLDSHYALSAKEALGIVASLRDREELAAFGGDLEAMEKGLESKVALESKMLESYQTMAANMTASLDAKMSLESKLLMEAEASLEGITRHLDNREATIDSHQLMSMVDELGSMATTLESHRNLESKALENRMLAGRVQQLESKFMAQKVMAASMQQLESVARNLENAGVLESRLTLESHAVDLASHASTLESRALSNMQGRLEMRVLEAKVLGSMGQMASSARQNLESRAGLEAKSLQSMTNSLGNLTKSLESRQTELGQRQLFAMQTELGAISAHLESKQLENKNLQSKQLENKNLQSKNLESRQLESKNLESKNLQNKNLASKQLESKQLESRQLAMKNLASFSAHLGNLSSALENRGFVQNRDQDALGARATELQNQATNLQNRLQM